MWLIIKTIQQVYRIVVQRNIKNNGKLIYGRTLSQCGNKMKTQKHTGECQVGKPS